MTTIFQYAAQLWAEMRRDFEDYLESEYQRAEEFTNGVLLCPGSRSQVDAYSLFIGPEKNAFKHCSEELKDYWAQHPRMSLSDFEEQWLSTRGFEGA